MVYQSWEIVACEAAVEGKRRTMTRNELNTYRKEVR